METCKYGSGAGKRKPTAVKRKGVVYRAYKSPRKSGWEILKSVNRTVKRVLKADVLNDYEVVKLVRLDNGLLMEFYSLELIIVLSYKWNTFYTNLFRKWMMKRMFESRKESRHQNLSLRITTDGGFLIFTFRD